MIPKLLLEIFLLNICAYSVFSLECYISPIPYILNYSITVDNLPSFNNNILVDITGEGTFTIIWLRNPLSSIIVFGYNLISNKNNDLNDIILASVQYQLEGDLLFKRLSHDIQFQCQSINKCNNEINLKEILKSIEIEENFSKHFNSLIASNSSFDNQSIKNCYFNRNSTDQCLPIDFENCQRCQITINFRYSSINNICATCPTITNDYNSIIRKKIFLINNRTEIIDQIYLSCQNGKYCNSIENIDQIRQFSIINFHFHKYFSFNHFN